MNTKISDSKVNYSERIFWITILCVVVGMLTLHALAALGVKFAKWAEIAAFVVSGLAAAVACADWLCGVHHANYCELACMTVGFFVFAFSVAGIFFSEIRFTAHLECTFGWAAGLIYLLSEFRNFWHETAG